MITPEKLDTIAEMYSEDMGFEPVLMQYKIKSIASFCRGDRLLDLGCGMGYQTKALAPLFKDVVGIDGSLDKIEKARERQADPRIDYKHVLFEDYDSDELFDTIVSTNVLEHVEDSVSFLIQACNLLSAEGRIIMTVPNALGLHKRIGHRMGLIDDYYKLTPADIDKGHTRLYDLDSLRNDFQKAGLKVIHTGGILLKPLSHKQMEGWDRSVVDALYEIGKELPAYCSSLIIVATK